MDPQFGGRMNPGLPHHRRYPRIDERRREDTDEARVKRTAAIAVYVIGVILLAFFAAGIL